MFRFVLLTVMIVVLGTSCAQQDKKPPVPSVNELLLEYTEQNGRACFRTSDIRGQAPLSDRMVSVSGNRKKHYLVTTLTSCWGLESSVAVGFPSSFSEFCGGRGDVLVTREGTCPTRHVFEFVSRDDALMTLEMIKARREAMEDLPGLYSDVGERGAEQ